MQQNLLDQVKNFLIAFQDARLEDVPEHILQDGVDPDCTALKNKNKKILPYWARSTFTSIQTELKQKSLTIVMNRIMAVICISNTLLNLVVSKYVT